MADFIFDILDFKRYNRLSTKICGLIIAAANIMVRKGGKIYFSWRIFSIKFTLFELYLKIYNTFVEKTLIYLMIYQGVNEKAKSMIGPSYE